MSNFTAFYDANVLVPMALRDLLMELATTQTFRAKWSNDVLGEMRSTLIKREMANPEAIDRCIAMMNDQTMDALQTGYEPLIEGLTLPDPDDRHVLAAAIHCGADVIVTANLKDFPVEALSPHGIEAQHPDVFIGHLLSLHPAAVVSSVRSILVRLKRPPKTPSQLLDAYHRSGLVATAAELRGFFEA